MSWQVGQKLQEGQYTIERIFKSSHLNITCLVSNQQKQLVIIKTLNETLKNHSSFVKFQQYFLNEALKLAKAAHPNLVKIEGLFLEGLLPCLVLEYIEGENLASRVINQGILSEAEALQYIQQIGEALIVLHHNRLLNQAIKPESIRIRAENSEAILTDFGQITLRPNKSLNSSQAFTDYYAPIECYSNN